MARTPKPTAMLEASGAFDHDPQRRAARENEPVPSGPLGDAPETFTPEQKAVWIELSAQVPDGVLTIADRILVEIACRQIARMRAGEYLKAAELNQIIVCLGRMGLTPADRSRLNVPSKPKQDAEDTFSRLASGRGRATGTRQQ